jgi:hypothetical protein
MLLKRHAVVRHLPRNAGRTSDCDASRRLSYDANQDLKKVHAELIDELVTVWEGVFA